MSQYFDNDPAVLKTLQQYWNSDKELQRLHDDFTENAISNYYLPFSIAPNFLINDTLYALPMVIEESSVVAAASHAAKFWLKRGGFKAEVLGTLKTGQVHFDYYGSKTALQDYFKDCKPELLKSIESLQQNMKKRGGGLKDIVLVDKTDELPGYYQLHCSFQTADAMGANFINSCLETIAATFENTAMDSEHFAHNEERPEVVLSILSNYVPDCLVEASVRCRIDELMSSKEDSIKFARDFVRAVEIAKVDKQRAVTHNKGIMNGVDAVVLASGNDFRAVEAGVHAYAARTGQYSSLTSAKTDGEFFHFSIKIPLALGTVGGLTRLHPMVKLALHLLKQPSAEDLMKIAAVAGLAQNFAAIRSLVTTGIQKGHMKMHLMNILNQLNATSAEKAETIRHFQSETASHSAVSAFIEQLRS